MSNGLSFSKTNGSLITIHKIQTMNNSSNSLADHNSSPSAADIMPVSSAAATTFSPVSRMPSIQEFHSLPSLNLPPYSNVSQATQRAYFYHDNGYEVSVSSAPRIKEEKIDEPINERSRSPVDMKPSPDEVQARLLASPKSSSESYREMEDVPETKPQIKLEVCDMDDSTEGSSAVGLMSSNSYHHRHSTNKIVNNIAPNLMFVRPPHMLNNIQPVLRYSPNSDTSLLNELLPQGGYLTVNNNHMGSILGMSSPGNNGSSSDSGAFNIFDGERRQESYNHELQLSPATFSNSGENYGLSENSNHDLVDDAGGIDDAPTSKSSEDENKRNRPNVNVIHKQKIKCRPMKSGSPNRTGTLPCPVCSKVFSNSSALAKHKLTHSDERKYVCQLCTKAFKRQDHLNGHLLTHMNKKPYECKVEGCGKSYCDARSLRRHTENHHAAMAQANAAVAAAAAVNAIAIRMGATNAENVTNNNSFLAAALQSNRIRYAPPPQTATTTASVSMARSSPTLASATFSNESSGSANSAASQLQLLAFQQSAAAANQDTSNTAPSNVPTWHQQQNVLFINSAVGQADYGDVGNGQTAVKDIKDGTETVGVHNEGGERIQSVLERHLKMGMNTSKEIHSQGQENASSTIISSGDVFSQTHSPVMQNVNPLSSSSHYLPLMSLQLKNQWPTASNFANLDFGADPKPVECNICQRRFKNIPALNGHMRLHGGYIKRDQDGLKKGQEKKSDQVSSSICSTSSSSHSPLQTASINVRALIEEKIIQKRIVNPPLSIMNTLPPPQAPPPPPPPQPVYLPLQPPMPPVLNSLPLSQPIDHQPMSTSSYINIPEIIDNDNESDELLSYESPDHHQALSSPNLPPPPPPPPPSSHSNRSNLIQDGGMDEDDQTCMQRQIEIIKQGLMSHQPVLEKFRRHSDSDHFLAPDRSSYLELYDPSSSSSFLEYMRQRIGCKRTQRTGSDPGEFGVGAQLSDMFSEDLEIEDLATADDDVTDAINPSEMMDFEMVEPTNDESSKNNNTSSLLAAALCSTPPSNLMDVIEGISSPFNVMSESAELQAAEDDDVFLSPSSIPNSPSIAKKKHRPEPLHIPPQVSTCGYQSRLRSPRLWDPSLVGKIMSPPPYTPPPMLSPVRNGPGLFWHVLSGSGSLTPKSAPITPGRLSNAIDMVPVNYEETTDSFNEPPETDIQPHVNIGPNFQARLPHLRSEMRGNEPHLADLVWDPKSEAMISEKEVEMYLQFACCAAIPGGGRNKEYALHVLHMTQGNIQDAMLKLMEPAPRLPKKHPLFTYSYAENDKWTPEEIENYQNALNYCDKDFLSIAQEVKTKTVQQCVQFYYLWKKICPDEYKRLRIIRRKREIDSNYNLRSKLYGLDEGPDAEQAHTPKSEDRGSSPGQQGEIVVERYMCDHPDCFASFSSRQALNGHIRIHGGNPVLSRIGGGVGGGVKSSVLCNDDLVVQPYSPSTNSISNTSTNYTENIEEFPCKTCGKVFYKVKSRNAHMKSHRPLDSDRHK